MTSSSAAAVVGPIRKSRRDGLGVLAWAGIGYLSLLVVLAIAGPILAPYDPAAIDFGAVYASPSAAHLLGGDDTGRDILSRLLHAIGPSLLGPAIVVAVSTALGVALAVSAAWSGGLYDSIVSRFIDLIFSFPGLILAILVVTVLGAGFVTPVGALSIAFVPFIARVTRTAAVKERAMPYIAALEIQGASAWAICLRHILPNVLPLVLAQAAVTFGYAIIDLAAISYLGLGIQPPGADLGLMIANGQQSIIAGYPQQSLYAAIVVILIVISVNVVGDAIADRIERRSGR